MTEISADSLQAELKTEAREEDCDKDSGNQSGEEMEAGEDGACIASESCGLAEDGPHCHLDNQSQSNTGSRKNSIAEELKAKIASVSRRNSWSGSRRGSTTLDSRRSSIQSIKEDPICEEVCESLNEGSHCHLEKSEVPAPASTTTTTTESGEDPTCKKAEECEESAKGEHCHEEVIPVAGNDVSSPSQAGENKQILQTISPAEAGADSNNSTPLTARKASQTPVNMKEKESLGPEHHHNQQQDSGPVVSKMPPTEHSAQNIENIVTTINNNDTDNQAKTPPAVKDEGSNNRGARAQSRTVSRSRSKSRVTSPSSDTRKSRLSSKERKSQEKLNHDVPDVANVKSKLDDKNLEYKPPTSTKRIETRKLVWRAESKIENNNLDYKKKALATSMENGIDKTPKKIENHKLEWKAEAKTVTRNKNYAPPSKSEKKIETFKVNWTAESRINTRENINYKTGGVEGGVGGAGGASPERRKRSRSSHGDRGEAEQDKSSPVRLTASAVPQRRQPAEIAAAGSK